MSLEDLKKQYQNLEVSKTKKRVCGKISLQVCFDRKEPTIKISDGIGIIEVSFKEFETLQKYDISN